MRSRLQVSTTAATNMYPVAISPHSKTCCCGKVLIVWCMLLPSSRQSMRPTFQRWQLCPAHKGYQHSSRWVLQSEVCTTAVKGFWMRVGELSCSTVPQMQGCTLAQCRGLDIRHGVLDNCCPCMHVLAAFDRLQSVSGTVSAHLAGVAASCTPALEHRRPTIPAVLCLPTFELHCNRHIYPNTE